MKFTISKSVIENLLTYAQPFLEKKDNSQITSHIYLSLKDFQLNLKATDYEIGYEVKTTSVNITDEGSITTNGKKLLDIVKILRDGEIKIEIKNNMLYISQKHSNFKLPTFDAKDFPEFPTTQNSSLVSIDSQQLITALKKITPSIDNNNSKYELNGALLDIKEKEIKTVSTDTKRLSIVSIPSNSSNNLSIIVPKKAIVEIQKLFFSNIEIYCNETYLIIISAEYSFFTKLINGKYPQYERIVPKETKHILKINKKIFIESLKQITPISVDIKLTFLKDKLIFEALSDENIEAVTEMELLTAFEEPFAIAISSRYIIDFLNHIDSNEFTLKLNESNLPFILSDENFTAVVMPIII